MKWKVDQRSNDGNNPDPVGNMSTDKKVRAHFLTKEADNEANLESNIGSGDDYLRPSEKTSNYTKVRRGASVDLSNFNHESDKQIRKEDVTKKKIKRHSGSENFKPSGKFCDEDTSCSESRVLDNGVKERKKYENKEQKKVKKEKQKGTIDFNFQKNPSTEGGTNLNDDVICGDLMGSKKDQKKQRKKKGNYNSSENSITSTDNCKLDEAKKQDKKRKMHDYFIESEQGEGSTKKKFKEASDSAHKVISSGDAHKVPSTIRISKRHKIRENKDDIANCELKKDTKKSKKKVSFSNEIEEFPLARSSHKESNSDDLVWGRFSPEEDDLIKKAIMDYIEANHLGEQGLHMILHCKKYRKQVKGCWSVITSALPWRPHMSTYLRAHTMFEKSTNYKWEPEEFDLLKRCYAKHGPSWKKFGDIFGKSRLQVKDSYRRIKPENLRRGSWGQDEYQSLFDLVNLDLRMKAFEEKKNTHAELKDNISWDSISTKLSTRGPQACCTKWYFQLTSSMVNEGRWTDLDDYKMIDAIQKLDPYCFEDVDWDILLENRSGDVCRKRWYEMIRHLDRFWAMPFVEQVDLLSQRYHAEMITYRQKNENIDPVS